MIPYTPEELIALARKELALVRTGDDSRIAGNEARR
jgi:hypothetical protein